MNLQCPIHQNYFANICMLTQLFGENKNRLFYGSNGHKGVDFKTTGNSGFKRKDAKFENGKWTGTWEKLERNKDEKNGFIPLVAAHDGYLTTNIYYRARQLGWGMFLTWEEDGEDWRLLYWHIETPWRKLGSFFRGIKIFFKSGFVRAGASIAIAGNTGYPRSSTGPHLHFELQKKVNGKWVSEDPMPYLNDVNVIFQKGCMGERCWFYEGKEVTREEIDLIQNNLPTVV